MTEVVRLAAFAEDAAGGNPAGVVPDARGLSDAQMLAIAAEVGFSETAFVLGDPEGDIPIRYFSPEAEVPFCGHATIATAVLLAERAGGDSFSAVLRPTPGPVEIEVRRREGAMEATLTSVDPEVFDVGAADVDEALDALGWARDELDPALAPRIGFAGARHLILAAATRERLADLDYDFDRLRSLMSRLDLTTVDLVWREAPTVFQARNPFPPGGVVEDPATGAAAAAFGAYLRGLGLVEPPLTVTVHQGEDMGRPSLLRVGIGTVGGIAVTGGAVRMPDPGTS